MGDSLRRSGRKTRPVLSETESGPNSPSVNDLEVEGKKLRKIFPNQDLSLDDKRSRSKVRALKNLRSKEDESSKFLSDFNPSSDRKAKAKVTGR